tara:strand:+ start:1350 stop:2744 length:1395 start_codon:yes stop_codon:yes gene_type:complete
MRLIISESQYKRLFLNEQSYTWDDGGGTGSNKNVGSTVSTSNTSKTIPSKKGYIPDTKIKKNSPPIDPIMGDNGWEIISKREEINGYDRYKISNSNGEFWILDRLSDSGDPEEIEYHFLDKNNKWKKFTPTPYKKYRDEVFISLYDDVLKGVDYHDVIDGLAIASLFIPGIGIWISLSLEVLNGITYFHEGEKLLGGLSLGFALLPGGFFVRRAFRGSKSLKKLDELTSWMNKKGKNVTKEMWEKKARQVYGENGQAIKYIDQEIEANKEAIKKYFEYIKQLSTPGYKKKLKNFETLLKKTSLYWKEFSSNPKLMKKYVELNGDLYKGYASYIKYIATRDGLLTSTLYLSVLSLLELYGKDLKPIDDSSSKEDIEKDDIEKENPKKNPKEKIKIPWDTRIYVDLDTIYDYVIVDGNWYTRKKNSTSDYWVSLHKLPKDKYNKAVDKLNKRYHDKIKKLNFDISI